MIEDREWGERSQAVYNTLDPRLQHIMDRVLHEVSDVSLISGHRNKNEQSRMFLLGRSKLEWPKSKHNSNPSLAVDFTPFPYPRETYRLWGALGYIAGAALRIAKEEGVRLRWGGDWNCNGSLVDQNFDDLFHLEIQDE